MTPAHATAPTRRTPPRTLVLLVPAAIFLAMSIDEFAIRSTGALAPRWVTIAALVGLLVGAWSARRMPWRFAIVLLGASLATLAFAAL
jgi:hypothetical protein